MSLRTRTFYILLLVFGGYLTLNYVLVRLTVYPSFEALEHLEAHKDLERCMGAIQTELYHLDKMAHDWAAWDETYAFVAEPNTEYITGNLSLDTFKANVLDAIIIFDRDWRIIWSGNTRRPRGSPEIEGLSAEALRRGRWYRCINQEEYSIIHGVVNTGFGPMLVNLHPIIKSDNSGPERGYLLFGRLLSGDVLTKLRELTRVSFSIHSADADLPADMQQALGEMTPARRMFSRKASSSMMHVYGTLPGIDGLPALVVRVDFKRSITARGRTATWFAVISLLMAGVIVMLFLQGFLRRTVIDPLGVLTSHVRRVGGSEEAEKPVDIKRRDEIGELAEAYNRMIGQLNVARRKITEQSYKAGMAEMASGILHNVRNTLGPLIGEMEHMRLDLQKSVLSRIEPAWKELNEGNPPPGRREDLARYVDLGVRKLPDLVKILGRNMDDLVDKSRKIEMILGNLQGLGRVGEYTETFSFPDLVQDTVNMIPNEKRRNILITLDPEIMETGLVTSNRITLMQVLANIIINACEAIAQGGTSAGQIIISARKETVDGTARLHVMIRDNGVGIDETGLAQIFKRGFSTKDRGGTGIGLHWCANAMTALMGQVRVESKGRGKGATFHVTLPIRI